MVIDQIRLRGDNRFDPAEYRFHLHYFTALRPTVCKIVKIKFNRLGKAADKSCSGLISYLILGPKNFRGLFEFQQTYGDKFGLIYRNKGASIWC